MPAKRELTGEAAASVAKKRFKAFAMAGVAVLPYDVYVEIIDWVYRASQHAAVDYKTLSACSLVCKAWAQPSQRLLFRRTWAMESRLELAWEQRHQLLLAIRGNPILGTYVRTLAIHFDARLFPSRYIDNNILTLVSVFPNITGIAMYSGRTRSMSDIVEHLRGLDLRIKVLRIIGHFDADAVGPLIDLWPNLTCLDIVPSIHTPPAPSKYTRAVAIRWSLPMWFPRTSDALREIELSSAWLNPSGVDHFLSTPALENITSLILDGAIPRKSVLDRCPKLETLVFAVCPASSTSLPVTLRHVGYHTRTADSERRITVDVQHLVAALRALPALQLVTATRALSKRTLAKLKRGCHMLPGVEFATYGDACMFKRILDADGI
ncbi:hypothetical protein FA95DRAFT_1607585 [Auriscalpium vulgare]|uniref:Uncharacterized protein n=1 Tax=Auriscalpium vulgare TaxID=40419 RepID=A0ACB8RP17_9AGAM|nr:hypothetical protein FA95DRAFT_1607585 [Auriscalpium vulgare]